MASPTYCCGLCGLPTPRREIAGDVRLAISLRNGGRIERVEKVCGECVPLAASVTMDEADDALAAAIAVLNGDA